MMTLRINASAALTLVASMLATGSSYAGLTSYELNFNTNGQSIWDTGDSFILRDSTFLGAQWQDQKVGFDSIAGSASSNVPNPARIAYDTAFAACNLVNSASVCINGQSARVPVPALGSRPSVRSCGKFAFGCQAARLLDIGKRATYDAAFATCKLAASSSVCRNGQSARLPVPALGSAPDRFLTVDTRTGAALTGTSDGRVGLELGIEIDSGSVDATVAYDVSFEIPDTTILDKSNPISFNTSSVLSDASSLNTSFSNLSLSVDAILDVSGDVFAEGCFVLSGCARGGSSFGIDERASVLSFNEDGEGGIKFLGLTPSDLGADPLADGFPLELDAGVSTTTLYLPQPNSVGGLNTATNTLQSTGQDDFIDLSLDLDNIVSSAVGLPGLFGKSVDVPVLGSIGYDIIDVSMGPSIDLQQDFELDPSLFVSLEFDKAVEVNGQTITQFASLWDTLPSITFLDDVTTVTPTFFVESELTNETKFDFDLDFGIDLLQIGYDFGLLGDGSFGIGNVLDKSVDLFDSPNFFSNTFALAGFDLQIGDSFVIDFISGSTGPSSLAARSNINQIVLPGIPGGAPSTVDAPATMLLLFSGLLGVMLSRRGKTNEQF